MTDSTDTDNTDQRTPEQEAKAKEAMALFDAAAEAKGIEDSMWLNAFSLIRPTDEFLLDIGRTVVEKVKGSMSRPKDNPVEPIGLVTLRITAS